MRPTRVQSPTAQQGKASNGQVQQTARETIGDYRRRLEGKNKNY